MLKKLVVRGFRSFRDAELTLQPDITVLVGPNGAGKSNVAYALITLANLLRTSFYASGDEIRFGGDRFDDLVFNHASDGMWHFGLEAADEIAKASYAVHVRRDAGALRVVDESLNCSSHDWPQVAIESSVSREHVLDPSASVVVRWPAPGTLPVMLRENARGPAPTPAARASAWLAAQVKGALRFAPEPSQLDSMGRNERAGVASSGRGFVGALRLAKDAPAGPFARIEERLRQLAPYVEGVGFGEGGRSLSFKLRGLQRNVGAQQVSDGTLLALFFAWLVETQTEPGMVLFLEDIDRSVHPYAIRKIVEWLEGLASERGIQIVLTTHSPELVTAACAGHIERLRVVQRTDDQGTTIRTIEQVSESGGPELAQLIDEYRNAPGALWYAGHIGGVPRDEPGGARG